MTVNPAPWRLIVDCWCATYNDTTRACQDADSPLVQGSLWRLRRTKMGVRADNDSLQIVARIKLNEAASVCSKEYLIIANETALIAIIR